MTWFSHNVIFILSFMFFWSGCQKDNDIFTDHGPQIHVLHDQSFNKQSPGKIVTITLELTAIKGLSSLEVQKGNHFHRHHVFKNDYHKKYIFQDTISQALTNGEKVIYHFILTDAIQRKSKPLMFEVTVTDSLLSERTIPLNGKSYKQLKGMINSDYHIKKNQQIIIDSSLIIMPGYSLNIDEGATIYAKTYPGESIYTFIKVTKGAKINISGTSYNPVVFTSDKSLVSNQKPTPGDWAGIRIHGNASKDGNGAGEMAFFRVEYAGSRIDETGAKTKSAAFLLENVQKNTFIQYAQVFKSFGQGFRFKAGNISTKYLIATNCADNAFRFEDVGNTEYGYRGTGQFLIAQHSCDSLENVLLVVKDKAALAFANITLVGPGKQAENHISGIQVSADASGFQCYNALLTRLSGYAFRDETNIQYSGLNGNIIIAYSLLMNNSNDFYGEKEQELESGAYHNRFDEMLEKIKVDGYIPNGMVESTMNPGNMVNNVFEPAAFIGAIGETDWTKGWARKADGTINN